MERSQEILSALVKKIGASGYWIIQGHDRTGVISEHVHRMTVDWGYPPVADKDEFAVQLNLADEVIEYCSWIPGKLLFSVGRIVAAFPVYERVTLSDAEQTQDVPVGAVAIIGGDEAKIRAGLEDGRLIIAGGRTKSFAEVRAGLVRDGLL
jgi:hypothetical protein